MLQLASTHNEKCKLKAAICNCFDPVIESYEAGHKW